MGTSANFYAKKKFVGAVKRDGFPDSPGCEDACAATSEDEFMDAVRSIGADKASSPISGAEFTYTFMDRSTQIKNSDGTTYKSLEAWQDAQNGEEDEQKEGWSNFRPARQESVDLTPASRKTLIESIKRLMLR